MYPPIPGTNPIQYATLPLRTLETIPTELLSPPLPTVNAKNIFAFWDKGITRLPPYQLRNVLAWHQRFSPLGWTIYVIDTVPGSATHVSRFLDTSSRTEFPDAFINESIGSAFPAQHTSDLVRFPLLLTYGGLYLDVGILQFGDLDTLWTAHIASPGSPYDFAGFTMGSPHPSSPPSTSSQLSIANFALMARAKNPLLHRAHRILLGLWKNRTSTTGMCRDPLVAHVPWLRVPDEANFAVRPEDSPAANEYMTDYAIQIQALGAAQRWVDPATEWDGPKYVHDRCWLWSMIDKAYACEQLTQWDARKAWELLRMELPGPGESENADHTLARQVVESVVGASWCLKLMHGLSEKSAWTETLGILWKKHEGSDCMKGTYAGWLRWAQVNLRQDVLPDPLSIPVYEATVRGYIGIEVE